MNSIPWWREPTRGQWITLKGTLVPYTAHPWAWAIFLVSAACELLLALLLLAHPNEMVEIPGESAWVPDAREAVLEAA